jgi:hypothetical protein
MAAVYEVLQNKLYAESEKSRLMAKLTRSFVTLEYTTDSKLWYRRLRSYAIQFVAQTMIKA